MDFRKFLSAAFIALALGGSFASCSSDDEEKENVQTLSTPEYEADAALFVIDQSTVTPYGSIELTAAGNYIVVPSQYVNNSYAKGKSMLRYASRTVQIIEGKYTKRGDNTYVLEGFGTVTVTMEGESAASLDISLDNGTDFTLTAARQTQYPDSKMTSNLCRSWKATHLRLLVKAYGRTMFDKEASVNNLEDLINALIDAYKKSDPDDEPGDADELDLSNFPDEVIFSKAGTYMVKYRNSTLAISTWGWEDQDKGTLRYSWDYEHLYDPDYSGVVKVSFPGGDVLKVKESYVESEEGETFEQSSIWTFRQL